MPLPLISVVIPTHNRGDLLKRALASVLAQSYRPLEVIVVDDNSSEDITSAVAEFTGKDADVWVLRNPRNEGGQKSRLNGVQAARGEIVALLDSDDWWEPAKLEMQYAVLHEHPDWLVACRSILATSGKVIPPDVIHEHEHVEDFLYVRGGFLQNSTFMASKSLLIDGLSHTQDGCQNDTSMSLYFKQKGVRIFHVDAALAHFDDFPRKDRISTSLAKMEKVLDWYHQVGRRWSPEAKAGFMVRDITRRYINNGMRGRAILTLCKAYDPRLPLTLYLRTLISIIFGGSPLRFFRKRSPYAPPRL